jgi:hypothetical protein
MWILRGQQGSLSAQANLLFEMVWRGMANPGYNNHQQSLPD